MGKHFDDKLASDAHNSLVDLIREANAAIGDFHKRSITRHNAELRCIMHHTPRNEFEQVVASLTRLGGKLEIDVMGLTLEKFYHDQVTLLTERPNVTVRLIVQDPRSPSFSQVASQEKRDVDAMRKATCDLTRQVLALAQGGGGEQRGRAAVSIRWYAGCPSLTMTRIKNVLFARPRFIGEADLDSKIFYEKYTEEDGSCYEAYVEHFTEAWNGANTPSLRDCG